MVAPRRMTAHTLEAPKGWPSPHAVDFYAPIASSVTAAISGGVVFAGRVVHLNSTDEFEMGVTDRSMAVFLFQNSDDPDVENDGGTLSTDYGAWSAVSPSGKIGGLVAKGAYELASTEFDSTRTYVPNDCLTAATGTTLATAGVLTNASATPYTNPVCGVVSRGRTPTSAANSHGVAELYFWPVYLPVA